MLEIIFVISALLFGIFLGSRFSHYKPSNGSYDGQIIMNITETGTKLFTLELNGDPEDLDQKTFVSFKVVSSKE